MRSVIRSRIDKLLISTAGNPFITSKCEDLFYFSRFTGDCGSVIISQPKSYIITTKMFQENVLKEVDSSIFDVHITDKKEIPSRIIEILTSLEIGEIFISSTDTKLNEFISVIELAKEKKLLGLNKKLLSLREDHFAVGNIKVYFKEYLTHKVRMVKEEGEIEIIKDNHLLSDEGFLYILRFIKPGVTEAQICAELEYYLKSKGAEEMAFPTIVASGTRSSLPHARASSKVVSNNEPIVIDFGIKKDRYCTDMTRTVFLGTPPQKFKDAYNVVLEALSEGISFAKEGVLAKDLDNKVRSVIERYGFGEHFTHSTGHSVGLEVHEFPFISKDNSQELKEGMVITIEPGIYIPGEFGIRTENMVLIRKNSCETLTKLGTELITL
ncbi:MAG: M24 family metallopeptidase [Brevinematia bacterium]